jgi:hypothetical protein
MLGLAEIIGDGPIFIAPGDSYVTDGYFSGMKKFCNSEDHGWVPTVAAAGKTWSYVRTTELNQVLEMAEKREISSQAATGVFGYKSKKVFLDSAKWAIKNNLTTHNIYYVSSTVQAMLITGQRVYAENIQSQSVYRYFGETKGREDEK